MEKARAEKNSWTTLCMIVKANRNEKRKPRSFEQGFLLLLIPRFVALGLLTRDNISLRFCKAKP
jgi:hypothetical protein